MHKGLRQDWIHIALGAWLFIAPLLGVGAPHRAAVWNSYLMGIAVVVFAWAALLRPRRWIEWINLAIGVWLIIAAFVLGFTEQTGAMWNQILVGMAVSADALWAMNSQVVMGRHA